MKQQGRWFPLIDTNQKQQGRRAYLHFIMDVFNILDSSQCFSVQYLPEMCPANFEAAGGVWYGHSVAWQELILPKLFGASKHALLLLLSGTKWLLQSSALGARAKNGFLHWSLRGVQLNTDGSLQKKALLKRRDRCLHSIFQRIVGLRNKRGCGSLFQTLFNHGTASRPAQVAQGLVQTLFSPAWKYPAPTASPCVHAPSSWPQLWPPRAPLMKVSVHSSWVSQQIHPIPKMLGPRGTACSSADASWSIPDTSDRFPPRVGKENT